jgi:hypothetical protein
MPLYSANDNFRFRRSGWKWLQNEELVYSTEVWKQFKGTFLIHAHQNILKGLDFLQSMAGSLHHAS